jgi:hypothetical protein
VKTPPSQPSKWQTLPWEIDARTGRWVSPPYTIEKIVKRRAVVGYLVKRGGTLLSPTPVCLARARHLAESDAMASDWTS